MSIASSRKRSKAFDADFQAKVLDVAETNSFPVPGFNFRVVLNRLMADLKDIGLYGKSDVIVNLAVGNDYWAFATIDWKTGIVNIPYGGISFLEEGAKGNAVDGYIELQYNPSLNAIKYTLNDAGRGVVVFGYDNAVTGWGFNLVDGGSSYMRWSPRLSEVNARINANSDSYSGGVDQSGDGFKYLGRSSATDIHFINKDVQVDKSQPATSLPTSKVTLLNSGSGYSQKGISFYFMSANLSFAETQDFRTIYNAYYRRRGLPETA